MDIQLYNGDCLDIMPTIPDNSVDMVLCDLPFGCTDNEWDKIIPLDKLWEQYKRVTKPNAAILLFGVEPFSSKLRMSNLQMYRYDWIWYKNFPTGFLNSKKMPLRAHEIISVFYSKLPTYNPQWRQGEPYKVKRGGGTTNYQSVAVDKGFITESDGRRYPISVIEGIKVANTEPNKKIIHPTQKPVALCEYLIRTYTNEGDIVLDNTFGSGSTGVACVNLNRDFIGIEKSPDYFTKAEQRITEARRQPDIFSQSVSI